MVLTQPNFLSQRQLADELNDLLIIRHHSICLRAGIAVKFEQHFALFNARLIVEMQHKDRRPTFRGLWFDHSAIQREMIVPHMTAGMKQERGIYVMPYPPA